jgi:hypothetical protein
MAEGVPYLTVRRPALNIGQEHIEVLQNYLLEEIDGPLAVQETIQGLFKPADKLYSSIITEGEFLRIQRRLGENRLDDEKVEELKARLEEALSACPETRDVATLPVQSRNWGSGPRLSLRIADSKEVVSERHTAQGVISQFLLGYGKLPRFARAKRVVPVELASSRTIEELSLLKRLEVVVEKAVVEEDKDEPFPDITRLGKIITKKSPQYIRG